MIIAILLISPTYHLFSDITHVPPIPTGRQSCDWQILLGKTAPQTTPGTHPVESYNASMPSGKRLLGSQS